MHPGHGLSDRASFQPASSASAAPLSKKSSHHWEEIKEFASRISFDIVNEAMVIATEEVLSLTSDQPHASCDHADDIHVEINVVKVGASLAHSDASSECSEEEQGSTSSTSTSTSATSIRTSWEYLPSTNTSCNLTVSQSRPRCPPDNHFQKLKLPRTSSSPPIPLESSETHNPCKPNIELKRFESQANDGQETTSSFSSTSGDNAMKKQSMENVPLQCDIYSLPIDNIPSNSNHFDLTKSESERREVSKRKSKCASTSSANSSSSQKLISFGSSSNSTNDVNQRNSHLILPVKHSGSDSVPTSATNSNANSQVRNIRVQDSEVSKAKSSNTETNSCVGDLERNRWTTSSRNEFEFVKEPLSTLSLIEDSSYKEKEKRTIVYSLRNLFRLKPRSKAYNLNQSSVGVCGTPTLINRCISADNDRASDDEGDQFCCSNSETLQKSLESGACDGVSSLTIPQSTEPFIGSCSSQASLAERDANIATATLATQRPESSDFAASIEKVKDCGWYWGCLSKEGAEDLLRGEPDGSFIVRDSSDVRYIFSLTFKLNGLVRHVRIEHDHGNFSFGPLTRFKASTIVEFIEKAVAHSRSGRFLFFLHRRPVLGPMRVQLLHPYSRYRYPRSLQHMTRFVILKYVRRDLIGCLPLPKPLQDYLNTPHYYFETPSDEHRAPTSQTQNSSQ